MVRIFVSYRRARVFVCYRRAERLYTDRLCERLAKYCTVIRDISSFTPGDPFPEEIESSLARADAVVVVIGPDWLRLLGKVRRPGDDPDYVMLEVRAALERGRRVVPALVGGARMPTASELPPELSELADRHALELSDSHWDSDVKRLTTALGFRWWTRRWVLAGGAAMVVVVALALVSTLFDPPSFTVRPQEIPFQDQRPLSQSDGYPVTVVSKDSSEFRVETRLGSREFDEDGGCSGVTLNNEGDTCEFKVRFTPLTPGRKSADLVVVAIGSTGPEGEAHVRLTGRASASAPPAPPR
jgi:hypothetical protein